LPSDHLAGNLPEHGGDAALLLEKIGAETGDVGNLVAEIHVAGFFENLQFELGRDLVEHRLEGVILQRRKVHPLEFAIDAEHRRVTCREVQVRGSLLEHQIEKCVNLCHNDCEPGDY
jgi:hypothetical protein